ncbi:beta-N-acetylglucosaminidase [hydrothermal vent metagenome]|uniref:beta-N-acetylhexosaminidase n=1 Tax=hydrothermal vent metagenome TaxID=652676 RepID=A0A3B1AF99_9ZZZZ
MDCDGLSLTADEAAIFKDLDPFGFILFARNCQSPSQLKRLTGEMKKAVGREDVPIFIDQEGGRVCRLNPEYWRKPPSGEALLTLFKKDSEMGLVAAKINARLMADELRSLGISVNCYPLLDLYFSGADKVIGDRSYGENGDIVAKLGEAACEGLLSGGVLPVIKHMPGHGRATVDSHIDLPLVETSRDILSRTDFGPFKALNHMPLAMTAHVVYSAIDAENPATLSEKVIRQVIREEIGFKGVLISDDINMKALSGNPSANAKQALRAGCDLILHCNAPLTERRAVLEALYDVNVASENWIADMFKSRDEISEVDADELAMWLEKVLKN